LFFGWTRCVFLYSFTKKRNDARNLSKIEIEFVDENDPFITLTTVNKLIQSMTSVTSDPQERLV
jgi:cell division protein FtsQ